MLRLTGPRTIATWPFSCEACSSTPTRDLLPAWAGLMGAVNARGSRAREPSRTRWLRRVLFRALKVPVCRACAMARCPFAASFASGRAVASWSSERGRVTVNSSKHCRPPSSSNARTRLERWFGGNRVEVIPARFEPAYLPFVLVPDREVELKRRIESDDRIRRSRGGERVRQA